MGIIFGHSELDSWKNSLIKIILYGSSDENKFSLFSDQISLDAIKVKLDHRDKPNTMQGHTKKRDHLENVKSWDLYIFARILRWKKDH